MLGHAPIAVVVPARNEAPFIGDVLSGMPSFVDAIVVVDDGSGDGTAALAEAVDDDRVRVIRHELSRGVGAAIVTGYRAAVGLGAQAVAVMAGDGQMDPADLRELLTPIVDGRADYAKGDRLSHPRVLEDMPLVRWLGNRLLSALTRLCTGLRIRDSQCGYTAISARAIRALPLSQLWRGYGYPNDLLSWLALLEHRIADVVVRPVYGHEESGLGMRHALVVIPLLLLRAMSRRLMRRQLAIAGVSERGAR